MSTQRQQKSVLKSVAEYEKILNNLSEEEFQRTPQEGAWSYSEVYSHIFQSNLGSLIAVEKCILGTGTESPKRTHWLVRFILFFGRFPPGRFKAPDRVAAVVVKIRIAEAKNLVTRFKKRLLELEPRVNSASPGQTIKHPRLGLLNASQWFRFIEIHTLHHTLQLQRIHKMLK